MQAQKQIQVKKRLFPIIDLLFYLEFIPSRMRIMNDARLQLVLNSV